MRFDHMGDSSKRSERPLKSRVDPQDGPCYLLAWRAFFLGTSFIEFNGKGFWTRDAYLEVWLGALVQEIDHLPSLSEWLTLLRQEWHLQATAGFSGCICPDLDRLV